MTDSPTTTGEDVREVADRFVGLISALMKGSSAPMVSFVEQYELGFTQLKTMFVLANARDPLPISRLAEMTGASLPAAGRAVDGLVRSGLVTRTEDPEDRRVKRVELTELGDEGMAAIYERRVEALRDLLDGLTATELETVSTAVETLRQKLSDYDPPNTSNPRTEDGQ